MTSWPDIMSQSLTTPMVGETTTEAMSTFSVATLNVHAWATARYEENVELVQKLVQTYDPDILCLQESHAEDQLRFLRGCPQFTHGHSNKDKIQGLYVKFGGCSIVSKFPVSIVESQSKRNRSRFVTAQVSLPKEGTKPLYISCIHLNHREEPTRLHEERIIHETLKELFDSDKHQIWTGDFNALTREDYDDETWSQITDIRKRNHWESPRTELTTKVKQRGFKDCWELAGRPRPIKTCRFDTRIDYVFATPSFLQAHPLVGVQHIDDRASDHNMVIAKFKL